MHYDSSARELTGTRTGPVETVLERLEQLGYELETTLKSETDASETRMCGLPPAPGGYTAHEVGPCDMSMLARRCLTTLSNTACSACTKEDN